MHARSHAHAFVFSNTNSIYKNQIIVFISAAYTLLARPLTFLALLLNGRNKFLPEKGESSWSITK
jgi:hypothetical protein